jgi:WD40 repeat protein
MATEIPRERWFVPACFFCFFASLTIQAAEPARLGELRGVWQADFNSDASRVVVRTLEEVSLWDARKGTRIPGDAALKEPSTAYVMSPDLRKFFVGFKDGHSQVFDASSGSAISPRLDFSLSENGNPKAVFSPDGGTIVFLGEKEASVLDVRTGKRVATIPVAFALDEESADSTATVIFAAEGAKCFVMDPKGTVTTYDTKTWTPSGKPMRHPPAESAYEFGFQASNDGKWIVTYDSPGENGPKGQLQAWDALTSKPLGDPLSATNGMSGRFLPGQNRVLVQGGRGEASVRELPSMSIAYVIKQHDDIDGPKVDVFPNGKWLIAWGPDKKVDLIDAVSGNVVKSHSSPASIAGSMIPPDSSICYLEIDHGLFLDTSYWDNYLQRLTVPELKTTGSIRIVDFLHRHSISSDGRRIMILQGGDDTKKIVVFDATTMKPIEWPKP